MLYLDLLKVIIFSGCLLSLVGLIIKSEFSFSEDKDDTPVRDVTENEKE